MRGSELQKSRNGFLSVIVMLHGSNSMHTLSRRSRKIAKKMPLRLSIALRFLKTILCPQASGSYELRHASSVWWTGADLAKGNEPNRKGFLTAMSQLHANLLKLLLTKKHLKISALKARKLRESLKKLHEDAAGQGQESQSYFGVPLHLQQQATSSLTSNPVPHILEAITSHLLSQASHEGILRKSGNERRANALKDLMEHNNAEIPSDFECSIHDVGCILKRWLRALPEPVIPSILHEVFVKCVELESHHHRTQSLLMACLLLPTFHLNTLKHVAIFLQEISKQETRNKMSSANLAKILAPSLMPCAVKVETNPEVAKKFSDMSTTAVQVLIDHAQLIASLPPELEPLKDSYKILSDDELSDHGEPLVKRKLFTFLKPKHGNHKAVLRSTGSGRGSRKASSANSVPKVVKRPTPPRVEAPETLQEPVEVKPDIRVTRSASKKRQLSAETVGRIRERRALRAIQNTRSQPSIRSLPAITGGKRRSVRRAATTCRAEKATETPGAQRFQTSKRAENLKLIENVPVRQPVTDDNGVELRRPTATASPNSRNSTSPAADKETARKSFLAAMLGSQESQAEDNLSEEVENQYRKSECISNGIDQVDSIEPALDRHGALRKPLMPSNRRAPRRETPVSKVAATITVQL